MSNSEVIHYSANELTALVERAMRGYGLPLAYARLMTAAAIWGELLGLSVLPTLAEIAQGPGLAALADQAIRLCDQICVDHQLEVASAAGGQEDDATVSGRKRLLACALAQCPVAEGRLLYLEAGGYSLALGTDQHWCAPAGQGSGLVARWMSAQEAEGLTALGGYRSLAAVIEENHNQGLPVDAEAVIAPLATLAHRVYVPATEASRQQAGAGETDND